MDHTNIEVGAATRPSPPLALSPPPPLALAARFRHCHGASWPVEGGHRGSGQDFQAHPNPSTR